MEDKILYWIMLIMFSTLAWMAYTQRLSIGLSKTLAQISIIIGGLSSMYVAAIVWQTPILMVVLGFLAFVAVFSVEGLENNLTKTKEELKNKSSVPAGEFQGIHTLKKKKSKYDSENIQVTYLEDDM